MNLTAEFFWGLVRGAGIGIAALLLAVPVRAALSVRLKGVRHLTWLLLLVPYLTPVLLVGYAYYSFSLSLVHYPFWNQALYTLLLVMKLTPVAALVLYFYPPSLSPEALHCHRLLFHNSRQQTVGSKQGTRLLSTVYCLLFRLRASGRVLSVAFALVFLFALGEFEMASLMGIRTWTVKLFDAQAGGLFLRKSLWLALLPIVFEAGLLGAVLAILFRSRRLRPASASRRPAPKKSACIAGWSCLAASVVVVTVIPLLIVLRGTLDGFGVLIENFALGKDIVSSLFFAVPAAGIAYLTAGWFPGRLLSGKAVGTGFLLSVLLSVPGLLGALLLSLVLLWVFQLPGLRAVFDSPVPLIGALTLLILPFAILLRVLLHSLRPGGALHATRLLGDSPDSLRQRRSRKLIWQMKDRGRFWVAFLLFCWAYFDLTASALLAPAGMTPVPVRLYNLMHYGQSTVLSASVCAAFAVPFVLLLFALPVRGLISRLNLTWLAARSGN